MGKCFCQKWTGQERITPLAARSLFWALRLEMPRAKAFESVICSTSVSQPPGSCPGASPTWSRSWKWPTQPVLSSSGAISFKLLRKEVSTVKSPFHTSPYGLLQKDTPQVAHLLHPGTATVVILPPGQPSGASLVSVVMPTSFAHL